MDWPQRRVAAGALLFDTQGHLLIVEPTYRNDGWLIPGGIVEANEPPSAGCRREVLEELGLDREIGRMLVIDRIPREHAHPEGFMCVFDGGVLTDDDVTSIRLQPSELASHAFVPREVALARLTANLAQRVRVALQALADEATHYLENGEHCGA